MRMITILTTTSFREQIQGYIQSIDQLDDLLTIRSMEEARVDITDRLLVVTDGKILMEIDWFDNEPPYLFPDLPLTRDNFLALIFFKLGNHQRAFEFVEQGSELYNHLLIASFIQLGQLIEDEFILFAEHTSAHNHAIVLHYGQHSISLEAEELISKYRIALGKSPNDEIKLFTAKHFLDLLLDLGEYQSVLSELPKFLEVAISEEAKNAMREQHAAALMSTLKMPFDTDELMKVEERQLECISFYEDRGLKIKAGLLLIDASEIANYRQDYPTSKEYISRAISYFREEEIADFLGEATLRKATLLYIWSKNGSPQYYKPAINAYQDGLKVFKRDTHPEKFAEIQHNLALIYSEIPVGQDEQAIWSAFCASAFKEALAIYTKDSYPYQFATVAHNYATALINFPEAKLHNNLDKANEFFNEALEIRTQDYPLERASTLLNQLELYWLLNNENQQEEQKNFEHMKAMANEIKQLTTDGDLVNRADEMLQKLSELESLI